MGLIAAIITAIICTVVYVRMYKRELPEPAGVKRAAIPVVFGVLAVILVAPVTIIISLSTRKLLGTSIKEFLPSPILSAHSVSPCSGFSAGRFYRRICQVPDVSDNDKDRQTPECL